VLQTSCPRGELTASLTSMRRRSMSTLPPVVHPEWERCSAYLHDAADAASPLSLWHRRADPSRTSSGLVRSEIARTPCIRVRESPRPRSGVRRQLADAIRRGDAAST
jgi:hypothetical protein